MKEIGKWLAGHWFYILIIAAVLVFIFWKRDPKPTLQSEAERLCTAIKEEFPGEDLNVIGAYFDTGEEEFREEAIAAVDKIAEWYDRISGLAGRVEDYLPGE